MQHQKHLCRVSSLPLPRRHYRRGQWRRICASWKGGAFRLADIADLRFLGIREQGSNNNKVIVVDSSSGLERVQCPLHFPRRETPRWRDELMSFQSRRVF